MKVRSSWDGEDDEKRLYFIEWVRLHDSDRCPTTRMQKWKVSLSLKSIKIANEITLQQGDVTCKTGQKYRHFDSLSILCK